MAIIGTDVDHAVSGCRGGVHDIFCRILPVDLATGSVKRIDVVEPGADIQDSVNHQRGGMEIVLAFSGARYVVPVYISCGGIQRVKGATPIAEVDHAVNHRRGR